MTQDHADVVGRLYRNVLENKDSDRSSVLRIRTKGQNQSEIKNNLQPNQTFSKREKEL